MAHQKQKADAPHLPFVFAALHDEEPPHFSLAKNVGFARKYAEQSSIASGSANMGSKSPMLHQKQKADASHLPFAFAELHDEESTRSRLREGMFCAIVLRAINYREHKRKTGFRITRCPFHGQLTEFCFAKFRPYGTCEESFHLIAQQQMGLENSVCIIKYHLAAVFGGYIFHAENAEAVGAVAPLG